MLVWTSTENIAFTGIRSPDRPARSESLYRLSYPGPTYVDPVLPLTISGLVPKIDGLWRTILEGCANCGNSWRRSTHCLLYNLQNPRHFTTKHEVSLTKSFTVIREIWDMLFFFFVSPTVLYVQIGKDSRLLDAYTVPCVMRFICDRVSY